MVVKDFFQFCIDILEFVQYNIFMTAVIIFLKEVIPVCTDILTDTGNKAFADSKLDMAIPFTQNNELKETIDRINQLSKELLCLTETINNIYAHGYITISVDSQCRKNV